MSVKPTFDLDRDYTEAQQKEACREAIAYTKASIDQAVYVEKVENRAGRGNDPGEGPG